MQAFDLDELGREQEARGNLYHEFLRELSLSMGLYRLPAGGTDPQSPHTEDEVYYVASGAAKIRVGDEDRPVRAGSVIYVPANVPHRFHTIEDALVVLVFFAPAEYSLGPPGEH